MVTELVMDPEPRSALAQLEESRRPTSFSTSTPRRLRWVLSQARAPGRHAVKIAAAIAVLIALAGCAGHSEAEQAAERMRAYESALLDGDGQAFCDLLTSEAKEKFLSRTATLVWRECPQSAEAAFNLLGPEEREQVERSRDALGPEDVEIRGPRARVTYLSGQSQPLRKVAGEWYIDGVPRVLLRKKKGPA